MKMPKPGRRIMGIEVGEGTFHLVIEALNEAIDATDDMAQKTELNEVRTMLEDMGADEGSFCVRTRLVYRVLDDLEKASSIDGSQGLKKFLERASAKLNTALDDDIECRPFG